MSDAPIPVWILGCLAYFKDSAATSISFLLARVKAQIIGSFTAFDSATTLSKSPGLDTGNPASITSTPKASKRRAISIFSVLVNWQPGTCSPSRRVVSNTKILLVSCNIYLSLTTQPPLQKKRGRLGGFCLFFIPLFRSADTLFYFLFLD